MSGQTVAEIKALWTYGKLDSGNLVVRKYKGSDPDVFVPETIGKATVTKLNDDVFKGKDFIRSIHLPDSINIIGVWAFENCSNLANINIPAGVTEIMWGTFSGCKALAKLYLPDGLTTIGNSAFEDCTSLAALHIPASTTKIEQGSFGSFRNCPKLTIFAPVGSYAEQYAKNNNIPFVAEEVL